MAAVQYSHPKEQISMLMRWFEVTMTMRKGVERIVDWVWNRLLLVSPFAPALLFYSVAPVLIVYFYAAYDRVRPSYDAIAAETRLPWYGIVVIFVACGFFGAQTRSPRWRAFLTLPMLYYAIVLTKLTFTGVLSAGSLTSVLWFMVGALGSLVAIRLYAELELHKRVMRGLEEKINRGETSDARDARN